MSTDCLIKLTIKNDKNKKGISTFCIDVAIRGAGRKYLAKSSVIDKLEPENVNRCVNVFIVNKGRMKVVHK